MSASGNADWTHNKKTGRDTVIVIKQNYGLTMVKDYGLTITCQTDQNYLQLPSVASISITMIG
jgi:hypothetical protein